jgi:hypothetical protein
VTKVYIGGSLSNPEIIRITKLIQEEYDAFSSWVTPGPDADEHWRDYEKELGYSYREALRRPAAQNIFEFDKKHIDAADVFVMVMPCGKSAHLELGYAAGTGKRTIVYMPEEPERYDVMLAFADDIVYGDDELVKSLAGQDGDWVIQP